MKHNYKITFILLLMFLVTQFIGLYVVNSYSTTQVVDGQVQNVTAPGLPYGLETPETQSDIDFVYILFSIVFAFVFAIILMFLLMKFKTAWVLRIWFLVVIIIALGVSLNSFLSPLQYSSLIALLIAIPLALMKIFKRDFIVHNLTELLIYPGIAAIFVPILNLYTLIALIVIISLYDMWAVWKSGVMQKMAKYQMNTLNIFGGFFLPHASKATKQKIANARKKLSKEQFKKKKFSVNVAILGGGDVVFPIIAAGVILKTWGALPAICVTIGATLGLSYLLFLGEKKKFYPAMPYISSGIFLGIIIGYLAFVL